MSETGDDFVVTRASATDDLADVEALQRRAFTNAWGAEALRWDGRGQENAGRRPV